MKIKRKIPRKNPKKFEIFSVYGCEENDRDDICYHVNDAYDLFDKYKIRLSNYEKPALIAISENDKLAGALFGGALPISDFEEITIRFSVVVDEKYRRSGIYRSLLKEFLNDDSIRNYKNLYDDFKTLVFSAWVINPNTIPVLEENGFESTSFRQRWSQDSPFYEKRIDL